MVQAIVFDLDYTLAVPDRDRATILADAADAVGAPPLSRQAYLDAHRRHLTQETREPIFADLLAETESDADPGVLATAYRETIADSLRPLPGVESMLDGLREQYRVGLLTNGPVRAQRNKLATLGWEKAFDAALVTGELAAGKPDPRAFEAILTELDVRATDAVYVGDEVEADIVGATGAGLAAIQVLKADGPDPDRRAIGYVEQASLADRLPGVIDRLS